MGLGMFDTCDNSLMVYIFGPQRSRPFTQSVHSFVGAGFVAGILLSKPFLPQQKSQSGDVCPNNNLTEIGISNEPYNSPDDPQEEVLNPAAQNLCFFRKNARLLILKRLSKVTAPPSLWKHRKFSRNRTEKLKMTTTANQCIFITGPYYRHNLALYHSLFLAFFDCHRISYPGFQRLRNASIH